MGGYSCDSHTNAFSHSDSQPDPKRNGKPGRDRFRTCYRQSDTVGNTQPVTDSNALADTGIAHP